MKVEKRTTTEMMAIAERGSEAITTTKAITIAEVATEEATKVAAITEIGHTTTTETTRTAEVARIACKTEPDYQVCEQERSIRMTT